MIMMVILKILKVNGLVMKKLKILFCITHQIMMILSSKFLNNLYLRQLTYTIFFLLFSDYTITKLDSDALRMSQRKSKAIKQKDRLLSSGLTDLSSHSMSGSQGSDEDDDDTSTPSVDHSDKNLTMFSTR